MFSSYHYFVSPQSFGHFPFFRVKERKRDGWRVIDRLIDIHIYIYIYIYINISKLDDNNSTGYSDEEIFFK